MGLSHEVRFKAPGKTSAAKFEAFLKTVEAEARTMGFNPTHVLNGPFDTPERKEFARRLTHGLPLQSDRLQGLAMPAEGQLWTHRMDDGGARVIPKRGVVLIVTDEHGTEIVLGIFRYPAKLLDINGRAICETGAGDVWMMHDFLVGPDPRYRQLVKIFREAGYVACEKDEFARPAGAT
jgi:hypothetical protein